MSLRCCRFVEVIATGDVTRGVLGTVEYCALAACVVGMLDCSTELLVLNGFVSLVEPLNL